MNLLLLQAHELDGDRVLLEGRRAEHVTRVLRKREGESLRVGVIRGRTFSATVVRILEPTKVELHLGDEGTPRSLVPAPRIHLLVAVPRPKALSRLVQTAASFRIASLRLIDGWRVDKAYFDSPRLAPERLEEDLLFGLEQGAHTYLPDVSVHRGFRAFLEDELDALCGASAARVVFHPGAEETVSELTLEPRAPLIVAFGPEGGFIESELESFARANFRRLRLDTPILRTETAVAAALGQLALVAPP